MCHTLEWLPSAYTFWLPCHKSDTVFEGNRILCRQIRDGPDPLPIMRRYIVLDDRLFPRLRGDGSTPIRSWWMGRFRVFFRNRKLSGQSMRAGDGPSRRGCRTRLDYGVRAMEFAGLDALRSQESCVITRPHFREINPFWRGVGDPVPTFA